jgi:hypothetical protein
MLVSLFIIKAGFESVSFIEFYIYFLFSETIGFKYRSYSNVSFLFTVSNSDDEDEDEEVS